MIKIKKEDFYKLKQLDRIEFRQRRDEIEDSHSTGRFARMINFSCIVFAIVAIMAFSGGAWLGEEFGLKMLGIFNPLTVICALFVYIAGTIDLAHFIVRKMRMKNLNEEYFKIELNTKGKKK